MGGCEQQRLSLRLSVGFLFSPSLLSSRECYPPASDLASRVSPLISPFLSRRLPENARIPLPWIYARTGFGNRVVYVPRWMEMRETSGRTSTPTSTPPRSAPTSSTPSCIGSSLARPTTSSRSVPRGSGFLPEDRCGCALGDAATAVLRSRCRASAREQCVFFNY